MTTSLDGIKNRLEKKFSAQKEVSTKFVNGKLHRPEDGWPPDKGLLPALKKINKNPNVATVSSCSGAMGKHSTATPDERTGKMRVEMKEHGGHPYIWLRFKNPVEASQYGLKMQTLGYQVSSVDGGLYFDIAGTDKSGAPMTRRATPKESRQFWRDAVRVFGE